MLRPHCPPSPEIMANMANHPQMALIQVEILYIIYNLSMYIYIYI